MQELARRPRPQPFRYHPRIPARAAVTTQGIGGIPQFENPEMSRSSEKLSGHTIRPAMPRVTFRKVKRPKSSWFRRKWTMSLNQSATVLPLNDRVGRSPSPKTRNGRGRFAVRDSGGVVAQSGTTPRSRMRRTIPSIAARGQRNGYSMAACREPRSTDGTDCAEVTRRRRKGRRPPARVSANPPASLTGPRRTRACPRRSPGPQHRR